MLKFLLSSLRRHLCLTLIAPIVLLQAACGELPRSFQGNPGGDAPFLSLPPTSRLVVPMPANALLGDQAARYIAQRMASTLAGRDLPVTYGQPRAEDWRLDILAETRGRSVVPSYVVKNADNEMMGTVEGAPISTASWAAGDNSTIDAAITAATPKIVSLLARIEATRRANDPATMAGRGPTRVALISVHGAPGDGNIMLTRKMSEFMSRNGLVVQDTRIGADWVVSGEVVVANGAEPNLQRVEIQWIVSDMAGRERGRVLQLNEVPAGSLNQFWGDVAYAVAAEASGGIRDVIQKQQ